MPSSRRASRPSNGMRCSQSSSRSSTPSWWRVKTSSASASVTTAATMTPTSSTPWSGKSTSARTSAVNQVRISASVLSIRIRMTDPAARRGPSQGTRPCHPVGLAAGIDHRRHEIERRAGHREAQQAHERGARRFPGKGEVPGERIAGEHGAVEGQDRNEHPPHRRRVVQQGADPDAPHEHPEHGGADGQQRQAEPRAHPAVGSCSADGVAGGIGRLEHSGHQRDVAESGR